ncbi:nucleotidyl transferase AbiEii/AbiGii toxin family protein [uncultured Desulfosarcina sp.]|uniref:nucleotidyl transferase AbiEii/AbiGii toxin family protein n=1 Tax=uncultured Desulfosarcina sp. TaxID=218289 RepID=UPI0029C6BC82|nr:nucleotidyl transferase AbiEii/AbiGii toxin family protein [uncultured Desulfosarcina sp.]
MTPISHNLVGKIDGNIANILSAIDAITNESGVPFFVVGATARDILLQHAYEIHSARATIDIDIGVSVLNWDQFKALKDALVNSGQFVSSRETQRLLYKNNFPVDIVPFGKVSTNDGSILWPPEQNFEMSVVGFQECYQHAISVLIRENPDLVVKVVSLAGLAILKIVSWDDNIERRGKDAGDLYLIIRNYIEAGNMEYFFEKDSDILKKEGSDYDLSSARFLGREISRMISPPAKKKVIKILDREASAPQGHGLALNVYGQDSIKKEPYERLRSYFDALLKGILDP